MKTRCSIVAFALFLAACGKIEKKKSSGGDPEGDGLGDAADEGDDEGGEPVKGTPVLAFFGGYTSCGTGSEGDPDDMELKALFDDVRDLVAASVGEEPLYLIACYSSSYESVSYRVSGDEAPRDKVITGMEADFEDLLSGVERPEVLLVGHSYGGWTAMDVALKLPDGAVLEGLVTLDPISHVDCAPESFLAAAIGGETVEGCTRAPTDFGADGITRLGEATGEWLNYYQTEVPFLHSGEFKPAKNFLRHYGGDGFAPHNGFLSDAALAQDVLDLAGHLFP